MLFGAMGFSYTGFDRAEKSVKQRGAFSANLGDNMQGLAVRNMYRQIGIPDERIVTVDRDTLTQYDGPPVVLPMNGCFYDWHFPLSPKITPVFFGFQARRHVVEKISQHLSGRGIIGCRDNYTANLLTAAGIDADVTGCLTFSLPKREKPPKNGKVVIVHGSGSGALPGLALKKMPRRLLWEAEFMFQRREMTAHPLSSDLMAEQDKIAAALLRDYHETAKLIITPLHHVAAPCMAAGIPVIVIRREWDDRFSFLSKLVPVHIDPLFEEIDWNPAPVDLDGLRKQQLDRFTAALQPWI